MRETSLALALSGFSFMLAIIWGPPLLRVLRHFRIGKIIRVEEPDRHFTKMGTPTMGGVMILLPVMLLTILLNAASLIGVTVLGRSVLLPLLVLLSYSILGALDDWEGIRGPRRGLGMRARTKFIFQLILALGIAFGLKYVLQVPEMFWPGFDEPISLGIFYIPIAAFIIVGMSNAVNFTDGLDGLAGLIAATAFAAYGGIALLQDQVFLARFCFTLVGAIFGFLWFNVHPAELFMGDTGSLSIGATLAVVALMTGQWLLLPVIAIIPVSEALSVVIQILYFKATKGKRFFRMAPLHYHFELGGWSETQVVQRFWLVSLLFAMLGVALAVV
ncbi:phospho-N-acetylmuramoyl-pentapeptide-transferase [Bellilinea caldifistulae]|jgi:phospho-N-acetylmuramoyl-pentapeptide-transferase|uniref:Phospho-N-acetylmuramoyl-pentapeptide-transferase n=1 Tax=Bellilinea caldifistulae TaxID=360411 RepID=A0A0P6XJG1_9CHLR|nr:phospho-N-acetylmuramoyl-pentapeptide-transferase [Bellilinea caldifistulae]KPL75837.1 phospho-N-acetylmuramoyl-pentapeptide-transferase [Bellilinea caldifistulae]GAP11383.1 phospho-N-acetylmuramoyl-pentapeptide-transferase [Bellilinea caldifistulae]